jgi:hypothetical protein
MLLVHVYHPQQQQQGIVFEACYHRTAWRVINLHHACRRGLPVWVDEAARQWLKSVREYGIWVLLISSVRTYAKLHVVSARFV